MIKKVLIVDDDASIARYLQLNFEKAGYKVATATNGEEALERVALERPALIVMDVSMPGMGGLEALTRLKADTGTASIPVVMLTADDDAKEESWARGSDVYLTKPIAPRQLIEFVNSILE